VTQVVLAACAGIGTFLLLGRPLSPHLTTSMDSHIGTIREQPRQRAIRWLRQAGLDGVSPEEFATTLSALFVAGTIIGYSVFGTATAALMCGVFLATFPVSGYRKRRQQRLRDIQDAWPRLLDDIRLQWASIGRSLPAAMERAGDRGPRILKPAFTAAHQEWILTTDFERSLKVLKARVSDPTADLIAETLLAAHQIGGSRANNRLAALADDRRRDLHYRHDARSQQAGARFARAFVLIIPAGMAAAGLAIGTGREAYQTSSGQIITVTALAMVMGCWFWAGKILRLPRAERVFVS